MRGKASYMVKPAINTAGKFHLSHRVAATVLDQNRIYHIPDPGRGLGFGKAFDMIQCSGFPALALEVINKMSDFL